MFCGRLAVDDMLWPLFVFACPNPLTSKKKLSSLLIFLGLGICATDAFTTPSGPQGTKRPVSTSSILDSGEILEERHLCCLFYLAAKAVTTVEDDAVHGEEGAQHPGQVHCMQGDVNEETPP